MTNTNTTKNTPALITKEWDNKTFLFREDGYFNMTKAAQAFGKDVHEFMRLPSTQDYLEALSSTGKIPDLEKIVVVPGNRYVPSRGTWGHPKLAVFFARWLNVRFSVACDMMIDDILKGSAQLVITKPEESSVMQLPPEMFQCRDSGFAQLLP